MANGDDAAAVGYDTVAGSEDIRQAYDEINVTRDYLAQHRTDGTHRANQITSGVIPVKHGGTGRSSIYAAEFYPEIDPVTNAIVTVSSANSVRRARGTLGAAYLGFRVHVKNLVSVEFGPDGDVSIEHGAPFTPVGIWVQVRGDHDHGVIDVRPRATLPSWNSENVFLRAVNTSTFEPYDETVSRIDLFCFGAP